MTHNPQLLDHRPVLLHTHRDTDTLCLALDTAHHKRVRLILARLDRQVDLITSGPIRVRERGRERGREKEKERHMDNETTSSQRATRTWFLCFSYRAKVGVQRTLTGRLPLLQSLSLFLTFIVASSSPTPASYADDEWMARSTAFISQVVQLLLCTSHSS